MKTILILGSSSIIGTSIARIFSKDNVIILSGRNQFRLKEAETACITAGAKVVKIVNQDLCLSIDEILELNSEFFIDLIVDAASAASTINDCDLLPNQLNDILTVDVISHIALYKKLELINKVHPSVIFISSILATIPTENRILYSLMKQLLEFHLFQVKKLNPKTRILIFRLGMVINNKVHSSKSDNLAQTVLQKYLTEETIVNYGFIGQILKIAHNINPYLSILLVKIKRFLD
jgi:short-subunit dehydrogenase